MTAPAATGRRERTKAANRAAIIEAARDVFGERGYEAAGVRDVIRAAGLAAGTFYNYFPDKPAVFRAVVEATGAEARRRVRAARTGAEGFAAFVEEGYRAYFAFIVEDPATFAFLRRNLGRAARDGSRRRAPARDRRARRRPARGRARAGSTSTTARTRWSPSGSSSGARLMERDPPDVAGATEFATGLFLRGLRAQ